MSIILDKLIEYIHVDHDFTIDDHEIILLYDYEASEILKKIENLSINNKQINKFKKIIGKVKIDYYENYIYTDCCNKYSLSNNENILLIEDEIICKNCIVNDKEKIEIYLETLENNYEKANIILNLENYDYTCIRTGIMSGFNYPYTKPENIVQWFIKNKITYIFNIDFIGQFDIEYSIYIKNKDVKRYNKLQNIKEVKR